MLRDAESLIDIYDSAQLILSYCEDLDRDALRDNVEKQDAILRRIIIIGEATKRLSPAFRTKNNQIPWREIAGMRDMVVHEYDNVNLQEVWKVVTEDLPQLLRNIEPLLPSKPD
ncbi:protein of unknown function DUF86 [[Leptolyngbya] sp. PCC 7376]|uniref:HepT-like ribonuclease domain-containing protein n=1 Tax=[Leptolyngbya] sp. PCC 7376 TaxID=111781 RepID=UPI00029F0DC5|nr:DUF86 domain-containing protein [[Leptolyngbya] sp. PCC 7376]AFY36694.1 protein of unknown function DUF86 [[Leptolyngbya] sp. PCC 7376]